FSAIDLADCINSKTSFRYPVEANCMVMIGEKQNIILYSLDFSSLSVEICWDIQTQISRNFNILPESVLLHTTHTHSGVGDLGGGKSIDRPKLVNLLIKTATEAFVNAKPAKIKVAEENVGKRLSVYRRGDTGTGLGVQTYWFGYEYKEGDDRPDASALINEMTDRWLGKMGNYVRGPNPVYFDGEVDPLVQTMYFVDMQNNPLGSIVRFSAHPHLTSSCKNWLFDPDFPGRTRILMEKELGGHCLFLSGPCANLVPKEKVKYKLSDDYKFNNVYLGPLSELCAVDEKQLLDETTRIGEDIARAAIRALQKGKFNNLMKINFTYKNLNLPIDPSLPKTAEEIEIMRKGLEREYKAFINAKGNVAELRRFANTLNWLDWAPSYGLSTLNENDRKNGYKTMPFSVLNLNSTPIVFMSSEIPVETTLELRKRFETLNPWTISLTGGSMVYIPTDKMIDEGGYEGRNTVIEKGTELKIKEHIAGMLEKE
ncbi:MAG: hypothetical protein K2X37_01085, partial [Chitinophagaceae bacterium]|nr:hypothetical protein [Chitinophagaceae bacterium]